jgi:hypothetical protein
LLGLEPLFTTNNPLGHCFVETYRSLKPIVK